MKPACFVQCLSASFVAGALFGCAPAHRCYSDGCVDCRYCPPPPLPYRLYEGCVCHSCAAERYLASRPIEPPAASPPPGTTHEAAADPPAD